MVAQALISGIKEPAKMILTECCSFMVAILPRGNVTRQAQIAAKRSVAKSFVEQTPPPVPPTPKANWWNRNWKWFVPLGCFSMAVLFIVFVGSVVLIVF